MHIEVNELQIDCIKELLNIGVNESTNLLSSMLNSEIFLNVPEVKLVAKSELLKELLDINYTDLSAVSMEFQGEYSGLMQLLLSVQDSEKLVKLFCKEVFDIDLIDEIKSGALIEIGNILLNAILSVFSNKFKIELNFYIPSFFENYKLDFFDKINEHTDNVILLGHTVFSLAEHEISGSTVLFLNINSFKEFLKLIDNYLYGEK